MAIPKIAVNGFGRIGRTIVRLAKLRGARWVEITLHVPVDVDEDTGWKRDATSVRDEVQIPVVVEVTDLNIGNRVVEGEVDRHRGQGDVGEVATSGIISVQPRTLIDEIIG